jgi:dTDP-4-amino-4,6-dideoxygalactose transaminase
MDLDDLERKITKNTKIILIVHWGGYPVDLNRLKNIQLKTKDIFGFKPEIIEDCAHAFGSTYDKKHLGRHGNFACYSFQAIKHLTTIDGGILISPDKEYHDRAKLARWYGIDRETNKKDFRCEADIPDWGFKFHMNDVSAAVGIENLKVVESEVLWKNKLNAQFFNEHLNNVHGLTLLENKDDRTSAYWIYSALVDRKDDFMKKMKQDGITVSQVHERNDKHTCVREFQTHLPSLDRELKKLICIPNGWWVTPEETQYIVDKIKEGW